METPQPPLIEPTDAEMPTMSLTDRLTDIFFSPGAVFDSIKAGPPKAVNWVLPMILSMIVGVVSSIVIFSQPAIMQQFMQQMHQKQNQQFQKAIKGGSMTEQQAADAQDKVDKVMVPIMRIGAPIGAVFGAPAQIFVLALVVWLLVRYAFHTPIAYMKAVEATGLAMMVGIVGGMVTTLLIVWYGDMLAAPSPALFLDHRDLANKVCVVLSKLNVFTLWFMAVLACSVARLAGVSWIKPALWIYGIWALFTLASIAIS